MDKLLKERPRKLVRSGIVLCFVGILLYLVSLLAWASPRDPASMVPQNHEIVADTTTPTFVPTQQSGTLTPTATSVTSQTATIAPTSNGTTPTTGTSTVTSTPVEGTPTPTQTAVATPNPTLPADRVRLRVAIEADYDLLKQGEYFTVRVDTGDGQEALNYYLKQNFESIQVDYLKTAITLTITQLDLPQGWVQEGGVSCMIDGSLGSNPLRLVGGQTGSCSLRNIGPPATATAEPGAATSTMTPDTPTQIPPVLSPTGSLTPTPITPSPTMDPNATATVGPSPTPGAGSQTPQPTATSQGGSQTPQPTLTSVGSPTPGGGTPVPSPTAGGTMTPPNGSPVPSPTAGTPEATRAVMLPLIQK